MPVANTALDWEDELWAMVMLPLPGDMFTRLQLLAHESFHRIQPELGHAVADPLATHLDEEDGRVWLRLELRALARALATGDEEARAAARDGLLFRSVRHHLFPDGAVIERQLEAHEGLAEYTGMRFALDATGRGMDEAVRSVERFETRATYIRSLGYGSGPALGLLLDRYRPGWRADLDLAPDLAALLATALAAPAADTHDQDVHELAFNRAALYGYDAVRREEAERAEGLATQRQRYRQALVEGPVLYLELPERRLMFNPNTVLSLGDEGNVYPGSILMGAWGRLTIREGAALASENRDSARVAAPEDPEPGPDGIVEGPGWTLELEHGWHLVPGPRPGDLKLEPVGAETR